MRAIPHGSASYVVLDGAAAGAVRWRVVAAGASLMRIDARTVAVVQPLAGAPARARASAGRGAGASRRPLAHDSEAQHALSQLLAERAQRQSGGRTLAVLHAPPALDGQGRELPTALELSGSVVTLRIVHAGRARSYPVLGGLMLTATTPSCYVQGYGNLIHPDPTLPFEFPFRKGYAIPRCRLFANGGLDIKPSGRVNRYADGNDLEHGVRREWLMPVVDSYGQTIAHASWDAERERWDVWDAERDQIVDRATRIELQGRGCMAEPGPGVKPGADARDWYLAGFKNSDSALRAFIPRAWVRGARLRRVLDGYSTGCGKQMGEPLPAATEFSPSDPELDAVDYYGHRGIVGGHYDSYNLKTLGRRQFLSLMVASTGVAGGGIVAAVLPVAGFPVNDRLLVHDLLGYSDPNVDCGLTTKQARWQFVRVRHGATWMPIWGFLPAKVRDTPRCLGR